MLWRWDMNTICDHFLGVGEDNFEGLFVGGLAEL
jgi:hypothetical protein